MESSIELYDGGEELVYGFDFVFGGCDKRGEAATEPPGAGPKALHPWRQLAGHTALPCRHTLSCQWLTLIHIHSDLGVHLKCLHIRLTPVGLALILFVFCDLFTALFLYYALLRWSYGPNRLVIKRHLKPPLVPQYHLPE